MGRVKNETLASLLAKVPGLFWTIQPQGILDVQRGVVRNLGFGIDSDPDGVSSRMLAA